MRFSMLLTLAVGSSLLVAQLGCTTDDAQAEQTGPGGSGGTTAAGGSGGATGTGGGCYGDAEAWAEIAVDDIPCTKSSDCCVVFLPCTSAGQVVAAEHFATAVDVWPYCDSDCNWCVPPPIEVECVDDKCVGYELDPDPDAGLWEGTNHCGVDDVVVGLPSPGMSFSCLP